LWRIGSSSRPFRFEKLAGAAALTTADSIGGSRFKAKVEPPTNSAEIVGTIVWRSGNRGKLTRSPRMDEEFYEELLGDVVAFGRRQVRHAGCHCAQFTVDAAGELFGVVLPRLPASVTLERLEEG
jgi:hypothetical protein